MPQTITIRRGYDIKLKGAAVKTITPLPVSDVIAVKPSDFPKVTPKLRVSPGEIIKAGQCLFIDKHRSDLRFSSPVSGEIAEIIIGEKRRILEIRILPDKNETQYINYPNEDLSTLNREQIIDRLIDSGCWNYIRQRPFSLIANKEDNPKAIFISCFDTSPLAPDLLFIADHEKENFTSGIHALHTISGGKLHIGLHHETSGFLLELLFPKVDEKHIHYFKGPHPSGNVGIQIHHINPIQKGEVVWYVHPQDVIIIGRLFSEGRYRADRVIALTGSCIAQPRYIQVISGHHLQSIIGNESNLQETRIIQGNVLHGKRSAASDFLSYYTNQITAIPEGNTPEFLGWLLPGLQKLSLSRTYFSWLRPKKAYALTTNKHGEERAFVMTGEYDKVLPMNIYPVFLLKAILAKDLEKMEALGIYEVSEEDFALCEFVCTSKIDVQQIISEGLDMVLEEG
jgi:Na+-transporting NADH:ubiquinone oxidoreductase subunit A